MLELILVRGLLCKTLLSGLSVQDLSRPANAPFRDCNASGANGAFRCAEVAATGIAFGVPGPGSSKDMDGGTAWMPSLPPRPEKNVSRTGNEADRCLLAAFCLKSSTGRCFVLFKGLAKMLAVGRATPVASAPRGTTRGDTGGNPESSNLLRSSNLRSSNLRFGLVDRLWRTAIEYNVEVFDPREEHPDADETFDSKDSVSCTRGVLGVAGPTPGRPIRLSMTSAAVFSFGVIGIAGEDTASVCPPRRCCAAAAAIPTAEGAALDICSLLVAETPSVVAVEVVITTPLLNAE